MHDAIAAAIRRILRGESATQDQMRHAIAAMMDGQGSDAAIAGLLSALATKGESRDEIVGAALALRERATRIPIDPEGLLDTCGTGGDELRTFNISTATAIVAAAAGVKVAKHGNRSVSSSSGSCDVLEALGVNVQQSPQQVAECIRNVGLGFCFAPLFHGAMKHVAPVRKELGFRTIFNLLGPLANPASAEFQVLGANRIPTARLLAEALLQLGSRRAVVVCGNGELDEVSLWGTTTAFLVEKKKIRELQWTVESFGLAGSEPAALRVSSPQQSAEVIRGILSGAKGPARDIVIANAAAALWVAERVPDVSGGAREAAATIDSGRAAQTLQRLVEESQTVRT